MVKRSAAKVLLLLLVLGGYPLGQAEGRHRRWQGCHSEAGRNLGVHGGFPIVGERRGPASTCETDNPSYTQAAKAAEVQGVVLLDCVVRKSGRADKCKVVKSLAHGSTERAIEEVETNWRFEAGRFQGQPVDVESIIEISFNDP